MTRMSYQHIVLRYKFSRKELESLESGLYHVVGASGPTRVSWSETGETGTSDSLGETFSIYSIYLLTSFLFTRAVQK